MHRVTLSRVAKTHATNRLLQGSLNDEENVHVLIPDGNVSEVSDDESDSDEESDNEQRQEDDVPLINTESEEDVYRWRRRMRGNFQAECNLPEPFSEVEDGDEKSPYEYFKEFFTLDLLSEISNLTNEYSVEQSGASINATVSEIEQFLGILIFSSILESSDYRTYWQPATRWHCIADVMGINRFEKLKRYFHLCRNVDAKKPDEEGYDPLFKIRLLFDQIRSKCLSIPPSQWQSIDEQMVPFKGRHQHKQYLPNKPSKWGFKFIARASSSGILHDFIMYCGQHTQIRERVENFSLMNNIVHSLCTTLPRVPNIKLFIDNYYTNFKLICHLKEVFAIQTTGTIRSNRLHGCPLKSEKDLRQEGRGSFDQFVDLNSNTTVVRWFDNKAVTAVSTIYEAQPLGQVSRWSRSERAIKTMSIPNIISMYNRSMGGVDLCDMLLSLNRIDRKSKKWYMRIVYYFIVLAVNNSWLIYRQSLPKQKDKPGVRMSLKTFSQRIAEGLTLAKKVSSSLNKRLSESCDPGEKNIKLQDRHRRCNEAIISRDIQFDGLYHLPEHSEKGRCKRCKVGYTRWKCIKCQMHFCMNDRQNCFLSFHSR